MTSKAKSKHPTTGSKRWIPFAVLGAIVSWIGLWGILRLPVVGTTVTVFFVLLFTAITTTMMPSIAYLSARFAKFRSSRIYHVRFVRQSIWTGTFVAVAAWLQMRRALNTTLTVILAAVFILTETFLITRESPSKQQ